MNRVGIFKKYAINTFYHAEIRKENSSYHYTTILLKKNEKYIDLLHPDRKIATEKNLGNYKIQWKNVLGDYFFLSLNKSDTIPVYSVLLLFIRKMVSFKEQSEYLRSASHSDFSDMSISSRH